MSDHPSVTLTRSTSSSASSDALRWGVAAVFALAVLGAGAAIGMSSGGPSGGTVSAAPVEEALPEVSTSLLVAVAAAEVVLFAAGSWMVAGVVRDVRRRRALHQSPFVIAETPVDEAIEQLAAAEDREQSFAELAAAATALTGAAGVAVLWDTAVAASAGEPVSGAELVEASGVATVLATGTPLRWVESGEASDGDRAFIAAPLRRDGQVLGIVVGHRRGNDSFGLGDLDLLCRLAAVEVAPEPALVDSVTDLPNRRRFDSDLSATLASSDAEVGLAVVAVDHLISLRHVHGDVVADALVGAVADVLRSTVRSDDIVYRFDDERFGVLLPAADAEQTAEVAERLRCAVESHEFALPGGDPQRLTISVGTVVAGPGHGTGAGDGSTPERAIDAAAGALDLAERMGRNRVLADIRA